MISNKRKAGGGKSELIRIGAFDDVDMSIVHHNQETDTVTVGSGTNTGFVSQVVRYLGREAHAASAPEKGINALNAASIGLTALACQRETFRDQDSVRVHPIITKGGNLVNVIPNEVVVETLIRAKKVKEGYKPKFTKEEYIAFMDSKMVREEKGIS